MLAGVGWVDKIEKASFDFLSFQRNRQATVVRFSPRQLV